MQIFYSLLKVSRPQIIFCCGEFGDQKGDGYLVYPSAVRSTNQLKTNTKIKLLTIILPNTPHEMEVTEFFGRDLKKCTLSL